jgi:hypothetical protein
MMLVDFLSGAVTFGMMIAALFFVRFWRRSGDELFLHFALAFALLGVAQAVITLSDAYLEDRGWAYVIRLCAFLLILFAIARKNRQRR